MATPSIVALIPARAGSKRVQNKNIRPLAGHPLVAYTIAAALESRVFSDVIVSTDSEAIARIARYYGAEIPFLRPAEFAVDQSADIEWVQHLLKKLAGRGRTYDCFSILRPTSPFRLPKTICRAWTQFQQQNGIDSLRAVEKCKQHPGKMWVIHGDRMAPLLLGPTEQPWHSKPYQALPEVYVQNASLEIAWTRIVFEDRTIAGKVLTPFLTDENEGFDINDMDDWYLAERLVQAGEASPPDVPQAPYPG
jgi:N-acylneuraminate cytidylyltransferase